MTKQAKIWARPELAVLTRSNPEEAVLIVCKGDSVVTSSAALYDGCWLDSSLSCNEIALS